MKYKMIFGGGLLLFFLFFIKKVEAQTDRTQDSLAILDLYQKSLQFKQQRRYEQAIALQHQGAAQAYEAQLYRLHVSLLRQVAHSLLLDQQLGPALEQAQEALKRSYDLEGTPVPNQVRLRWIIGEIQSRQGDAPKAIQTYQKALDIARALEDEKLEMQGLTGLGATYYACGDLEQALKTFKKQEAYLRQKAQIPSLVALYNNVGALHYDLGNRTEAVAYMEQTLALLEGQPEKDWERLVRTHRNLAILYKEQEEPHKALEYLNLSEAIIEQYFDRDPALLLENLVVKATIEESLGHFSESLKTLQQEMALRQAQANQERAPLHNVYLNSSAMHRALKEFEQAEQLSQRILEDQPNERIRCRAMLERMYAAHALRGLEQGQHWADQARQCLVALYGTQHYELANIDRALAKWHAKAQQPLEVVITYLKRGALALRTDTTASLDQCIAREAYERGELLCFLLTDQAAYRLSEYDQQADPAYLKAAAQDLAQAKQLIAQLAARDQQAEDKRHVVVLAQKTYEQTLRLQHLLAQQAAGPTDWTEALQAMENNKSIVLADAVRGQQAQRQSGIPDSLLQRKQQLQTTIDDLVRQRWKTTAAQGNAETELELAATRKKLTTLQQNLLQAYPQYARMLHQNSQLDVAELQQKVLDPQTALLEYLVSDSTLYLLAITQQTAQLYPLPYAQQQLEEAVEKWRQLLVNYKTEEAAASLEALGAQSHALFQQLLAPALDDLTNIQTLLVVPDGVLGHVPFEVLLTQPPTAGQALREWPYLCQQYTLRYSYSSTLLLEHQKTAAPPQNKGRFLALAGDYGPVDSTALWQRSWRHQNLRQHLQPLPAAQQEVEALEQFYPNGHFWLGKEATEEQFKASASQYEVLHLAVHGLLHPKHPTLSALALTEDGHPEEDNFLHAYEIARLNLTAQLVVLSACETGYGQYQAGEGVMSLARSFMYAGVPSTVVSLWQVNDYATALIMKLFYEQLETGKPVAEALTLAKRQYLAEAPALLTHPVYWAAFITIGQNTALTSPQTTWWSWGLSLGALALLLAGLGYGYHRRRQQ